MITASVLLAFKPAPAAQKFESGDSLVVLSTSGLTIREKCDMRAKVLGLAPCGALVMMEGLPAGAPLKVEGIEGRWAKVTYRGITGYAFDGILGRLRAPEEECGGLEEYFNGEFRPAGSPVEKSESGEGSEERVTELAFSNGATIRHKYVTFLSDAPGWSLSTYTLPGITRVEEVFLVLKLLGYIEQGFAFPARSGRAGFTKKGSAVQVDIFRQGNDVIKLDMTYRRPDFSGHNAIDNTAPRIVISRDEDGIVIDLYNLKR